MEMNFCVYVDVSFWCCCCWHEKFRPMPIFLGMIFETKRISAQEWKLNFPGSHGIPSHDGILSNFYHRQQFESGKNVKSSEIKSLSGLPLDWKLKPWVAEYFDTVLCFYFSFFCLLLFRKKSLFTSRVFSHAFVKILTFFHNLIFQNFLPLVWAIFTNLVKVLFNWRGFFFHLRNFDTFFVQIGWIVHVGVEEGWSWKISSLNPILRFMRCPKWISQTQFHFPIENMNSFWNKKKVKWSFSWKSCFHFK